MAIDLSQARNEHLSLAPDLSPKFGTAPIRAWRCKRPSSSPGAQCAALPRRQVRQVTVELLTDSTLDKPLDLELTLKVARSSRRSWNQDPIDTPSEFVAAGDDERGVHDEAEQFSRHSG